MPGTMAPIKKRKLNEPASAKRPSSTASTPLAKRPKPAHQSISRHPPPNNRSSSGPSRPKSAPRSSRDQVEKAEESEYSEEDEKDSDDNKDEEEDGGESASSGLDEEDTIADATAPNIRNGEGSQKSFADLGIIPELIDACTNLGYTHPTPIQEQSIPLALQGRDIIGLAETGSGKTAAFVLPLLQELIKKPQPLFGLVLAPTRELAYQISQQVEALGSLINVKCAVLVGGMDMVAQAIALGKKPHVVVATPGRLMDHLENTKGFSLKHLKYLVMDEADRLLDLDFGPILDKILKVLPREGRHTYLFSATMSSKVENLQRASLHNPLRVSISSNSHQTVLSLIQKYIFIPSKHKDVYLMHLINENLGQRTIIFTRTVNETRRIAILLRTLGFGAIPLHGQLSQSARLGALQKFRSRGRDILVATDVAARGLDIPSVDLVINFDLPGDSKTYVHRVGRTARAGMSGKAISFVTQYEIELWLRIENALGKKLDEEGIPKDEVLVLLERVGEAQRVAVKEMKEIHDRRGRVGGGSRGGGHGHGRRGRDDMDREEG